MSELSDKLAYARGLFEGMGMDANSPEGKLMGALMDALKAAQSELDELRAEHAELRDYVDIIDDDVSDLADEVYGDCADGEDWLGEDDGEAEAEVDDDDDDQDDEFLGSDYDCGHDHVVPMFDHALADRECPNCGNKITITMRTLCHPEEPIVCPSCGSKFIAADPEE